MESHATGLAGEGGAAKLRHHMHVLLRRSRVIGYIGTTGRRGQLSVLKHCICEAKGSCLVRIPPGHHSMCARWCSIPYSIRRYVRAGLGSPQMQVQVHIPIFSFGIEGSMICLRPCASPRERLVEAPSEGKAGGGCLAGVTIPVVSTAA